MCFRHPIPVETVAEDVPLCAFDEIQKSLEREIKKGRVRKIYEISLGYIFYCEPGVYVPDSGEYDYADIFYDVKPMWRVNCLKASGAQKELEEAYSDGTVTDDERNTVAYTQFLGRNHRPERRKGSLDVSGLSDVGGCEQIRIEVKRP